jgi:hypothetical protein
VELAGLLDKNPGLTDPDDVPEPPTHPVTEPGEMWQLGRHRLLCGEERAVARHRLQHFDRARIVLAVGQHVREMRRTDLSGW